MGGSEVLGLAPPCTEIHTSLKHGTVVLAAESLQAITTSSLKAAEN